MNETDFCSESVRFDGTPMHCIRHKDHGGIHTAHLSDSVGGQHEITWRAGRTFIPRHP
jgi:hypothetical protein